MNIKSIVVAATLITACAVSAPVFAEESSVKQIVSNLVKQAVTATSNEIEVQIDKVIITSGHMLSLNRDAQKGKVTITDIATAKKSREAEQDIESSDE